MVEKIQEISREASPLRNGRLYLRDLEPIHKIKVTAVNGRNGNLSEFSLVPILKRLGPNGKNFRITYLYEGPKEGEPFGFYKLGNQNEVYVVGNGSLIESHTNGHLVNPHDCREMNPEYIEASRDWDMAFDVLRNKQTIPIAAHNIDRLSLEKLDSPIRMPKTSGYLRRLAEAQRL